MGRATSSNNISYGPSCSFPQFYRNDCYIVENDVKSQVICPSIIVYTLQFPLHLFEPTLLLFPVYGYQESFNICREHSLFTPTSSSYEP